MMRRSCIHPQQRRAGSQGQRGVRYALADCGRPGRYVGVALLLLGLLLGACNAQQEQAENVDSVATESAETPAAEATAMTEEVSAFMREVQTEAAGISLPDDPDGPVVALGEIDNDPQAYLNQTVTVRGMVSTIVGKHAFQFDDPALLGADDVLVVDPQGQTDFARGDMLVVRGTVRRIDLDAVETDIDLDVMDDMFPGLEEGTVIVAWEIMDVSEDEMTEVMSGDILADPEAFLGDLVVVEGVVTAVFDEQVFRMSDNQALTIQDNILVVLQDQDLPAELEDGMEVQVRGMVQPFYAVDFNRDLDFDPQIELGIDYENQPTIVASSVRPAELPQTEE